jgi:membrane peptidoglycan carboxypeptidase
MPTGLPIPGETSGTLRKPEDWSGQSPASLAIGYEISVSPLQLAMAYGALANGGRLMAPKLIREVRAADGSLIERSEPRVIRQVISSQVARDISRVLVEVTESGTGTRARLTSFSVAGKSGTSRAYRTGGGYAEGEYFATFVGFFPAEDPQLLAYVKLDSPKGVYYGGAAAAPVIRATMEAILAAEQPPVDRRVLAHAARRPAQEGPVIRFASTEPPSLGPEPAVWESGQGTEVVVPDVRGLSARAAVRQLHTAGLRVVWEAPGPVFGTWPAAGTMLMQGDTVAIDVGRAERERSR